MFQAGRIPKARSAHLREPEGALMGGTAPHRRGVVPDPWGTGTGTGNSLVPVSRSQCGTECGLHSKPSFWRGEPEACRQEPGGTP